MKLSELIKSIGIKYNSDVKITDITDDSRKIIKGSLFVCVKGRETDGHEFCDQATEMGAAAIVVRKGMAIVHRGAIPIFEVDDTRVALVELLKKFYGAPSDKMKLVAVTGTNGKTSTVSILDAIFRKSGYKTGMVGTLSCKIGDRVVAVPTSGTHSFTTPDISSNYKILSEMANQGVEYVFMEASSHALAEGRLAGLEFFIGIFTNLSVDHLDYHKNMEEYFKAKSKLFDISQIKLFNIDDRYGNLLLKVNSDGYSYGKREQASFRIEDDTLLGDTGIHYSLKSKYGVSSIYSPLVGNFAIYNTAAAVSAALICNISLDNIISVLSDFSAIDGRMERIRGKQNAPVVFIDYAHSPDALRNVLDSVRSFRKEGQRITVLFGCGGERDRSKRPEMGRIATALADMTVITSDNSRNESPEQIFKDIMKGVDKEKPYAVIPDRKNAIRYAINNAYHNDIILLCGKGHEKYEINNSGIHPFDEAALVREILDS